MIDCRRFVLHMHPLASGEVEGALALSLSCHAASCPACGAKLHSAQRVADLLERSPRHTVEPPARLVHRVMAALPAVPRIPGARRYAWGIGLAASLTAAVGLTLTIFLAGSYGPTGAPQLAEVRSVLAAVSSRLQQFSAVLESLAGELPRLQTGLPGIPASRALLPGLALLTTGLLGTLTALYLSTWRGLIRARRA